MEHMHRLFIGIEVDETTRAACAGLARRLESRGLTAKYVAPENYHLTLLFLGNVEPAKIAAVEAACASVAARHPRFTVAFDRIGAFPHERKPRVVFAGSRGADPAYRALAADVRGACEPLCFGSDDAAVPHLTLARVPEKTRTALPMIDVTPFSLSVERLALFESLPHDGRTRYAVLAAFPLVSAV